MSSYSSSSKVQCNMNLIVILFFTLWPTWHGQEYAPVEVMSVEKVEQSSSKGKDTTGINWSSSSVRRPEP